MVKKLLLLLGLICAAFFFWRGTAHAQLSNLWMFNGTLQPVVSTWPVEARIFSGATISSITLKNCTSIGGSSTGALVCLSSGTGFGTGNVVAIGDRKYVNVGGDTMTGGLTINLNTGYLALRIIQTISGSVIHAEKGLSTSGSLSIEGTNSGAFIRGYGLATDCDTATTSKLLWDSTLGRFSCGTDTDTNTTYTAAKGLTLVGTAFQMNAAMTGTSLKVSGTVSGALAVFSNYHTCTLKTGGTGNVICGSDLNSDLFNTGSLLSKTEGKYVNIGGDTMTGALTIDLTSGYLGLKIIETASGARIHAEQGLSSSGTLVFEGAASGSSLYLASSLRGIGLTDCDGATSLVQWDTTSGRFSCATGSFTPEVGTLSFSGAVVRLGNTQWVNQSGDTMTGALTINLTSGFLGLNVKQTISGSIVHASLALTSSGNITAERTISGALVTSTTVSGSVIRFNQLSVRKLHYELFATGSTIATGSGKMMISISDPTMTGYILKTAHLVVQTAGTTNTTSVQIRNNTRGNCKLFSTVISIDSAEVGSDTAATPYVINSSCAQVGGYDRLLVDLQSVSTTAPKGSMQLHLEYFKP